MIKSIAGIPLLFLASLMSGCSDSGSSVALEPNEAHKAIYEQLVALEGDVALDTEGNIITVALCSKQVGNDDLEAVAKINTLIELNLAGSGIDDDGLEKLESLSNLKVLEIEDCKVSRRAVAKLKSDLQTCNINSDFDFSEEDE